MSMKPISDRFSEDSGDYLKYRPSYPKEFIKEILSLTEGRTNCWDCGTGNGQVALELSDYFKQVFATDISDNQLHQAIRRDNIQYSVSRAEKTPFKDDFFDLITVAQAIHWFDLNRFYTEAERVSRKQGILAVWGYGLVRFEKTIDQSIDHFYHQIVGPFWDEERKHIDNSYSTISFPFEEIELVKEYHINKEFTLDEFRGYLSTWSAVKHYKEANNHDPVEQLTSEISAKWHQLGRKLTAKFPLFSRIGRIK